MKKILLIQPNINKERRFDQLGLDYIHASLISRGIGSKIFNMFGEDIEEIRQPVSAFSPEIVGIYCNSPLRNQSLRVARLVKRLLPKTKVVLGGPHATLVPVDLLKHDAVEYVIVGEGEFSMLNLIASIDGKGSIENVGGICYRDEKGEISLSRSKVIQNLDEIPFPTREEDDGFSRTVKINSTDGNYVPLITTRGCVYKCSFCSGSKILGKSVRKRSIDNITEELTELRGLGFNRINLLDDNISLFPDYFQKVTETLGNLGFTWIGQSRVDLHRRFGFAQLKKWGCEQIEFGVESGSPRVLRYLAKGNSLDDVASSFEQCRSYGIRSFANFIVGSPNETVEDVRKTFDLIEAIAPDSFGLWIATPYPGTRMFDDAQARKILVYQGEELFDVFERINSTGITNFQGYFRGSGKCLEEARKLLGKCKYKSQLFKPRNNHSYVAEC